MSKKDTLNQQKMSRNDRFAQMSHQEKIIEQKKKEILAKLEAKNKASEATSLDDTAKASEAEKKSLNVFNNDGSFLSNFKSMKEKKSDLKHKSLKSKEYSDDRGSKLSKWGQIQGSSSKHLSKFQNRTPDKNPPFEQQKITINTSFKNTSSHQFRSPPRAAPEIQKQCPTSPVKSEAYTPEIEPEEPKIHTALPPQCDFQCLDTTKVLTGVPSSRQLPQMVLSADGMNLQPVNFQNLIMQPVLAPMVELASIPPPNPIQIQNIPQPDPINTMNIPQPAPIKVQNIPTPSSLQLNEIPNPKPLDLMAIPTPNEKRVSVAEFLKNVPPPNKSVPPPSFGEVPISMSVPPPPPPNVAMRNLPSSSILLQNIQNPNNFPNPIPSLMAQPILPPPGLPQVNISCPPPILGLNTSTAQLQTPPPGYLGQAPPQMNQAPPRMSQMPPMNVPPPPPPIMNVVGPSNLPDMHTGTSDYEAMASLARMVAQCGPSVQEVVQQRKKQDPSLWFLFHKESAAYQQYQQLIGKFKNEMLEESLSSNEYKPEDAYEPEAALEDEQTNDFMENSDSSRKKRKRSRWGEKVPETIPPVAIATPIVPLPMNQQPGQVMLSKVTRTDPGLLQYARQTFNTVNLTEEQWERAEDHYKINLLYQDMVRKREEADRLRQAGKNRYDYDSDEDVEGGTWEHKLRDKEMMATQLWADELTRQAEGKHHIGDFLPPEEFKRFMEKSNAAKEGRQLNLSDYKEFKLKEDNIGFKMLQKLGWTEGTGLGSEGKGIVEPVNKAASRDTNQGLGLNSEEFNDDDDEYESYRKRMMLAYRFRPNPLNNPRRPYY